MIRKAAAALVLVVAQLASADEKVDLDAVTRIRAEGLNRSKVMETLSHLCDEIGPRLTGSPGYRKASEWTRQQLEDWGLSNAHVESFAPFGRGWTLEHVSVEMLAPGIGPIPALAKAWTPETVGVQRGEAILAKIEKEEEFETWKGKLAGKIVLLEDAPELKPHEAADAKRYTSTGLEELSHYEFREPRKPSDRDRLLKRNQFRKKLLKFLEDEKVLATVDASRGDDGTIFVQGGGSYKKDEPTGPPAIVMGSEAYGRIARLLERKLKVQLAIDVRVAFTDEDPAAAANTIAEIPGTDKKDEVVMLGAHLDSWHGGTGATDNGAGSAVAMEAIRILKAAGLKPRRTVRIALWGGEEQGLLGSKAYVSKHFASRAEPTDPKEREIPSYLRQPSGPITFLPEHKKLAAYFNFDNGTGKVRGIYAQENAAAVPIFEAWLAPFHDLGATTVTMRNTGGTDHLSFDAVGLPGFQFIQDELDYMTRTHHSNMDVYERVQRADMMQAAVVMAGFVYDAAMRDQMMPRKPIPPDPAKEKKEAEEKTEKADRPAKKDAAERAKGLTEPLPVRP
jgi:carboxypeptidase Q